jgi:hypothetical protein
MTVNERLTRLEAAVTSFVQSSTEFQTEIMRLVRTHNAVLEHHSERIERLDAMVKRFDEWLRGEGPIDGHKKRKK